MRPAEGRIGIIAGSGRLPLHVARYMSGAGKDVYVAGLLGNAGPEIDGQEWETGWYAPYSLQELLEGLRQAGVERVVLAGRLGHEGIFHKTEFDPLLGKFLDGLVDHRPATILGGLVDLLTRGGWEVISLLEAAADLLPGPGRLAGPPVAPEQVPDIELGWRVARAVADQDVGQTVIVKGGAVVAVEAMEGTDRAIARAGTISGGALSVVKLAATNHDFRFDVPTIGPDTVRTLDEAGGGLIVVEAGCCFILDMERVSALCDERGISLFSCREAGDGRIHWPEA